MNKRFFYLVWIFFIFQNLFPQYQPFLEGDLGEYKKMAADYGIVYNRNGVNKVYKFNDVDSGNLFSYINIVIANIYNSSKYVIQLNDFENKKMVIKASTGVPIPQDSIKIIKRRNFRKMSLYNEIEEEKVEERDYVVYTHNYTLNIGVRDNRFKIEFEYGEVDYIKSSDWTVRTGPLDLRPIIRPTLDDLNNTIDFKLTELKEKIDQKVFWGKKKRKRVFEQKKMEYEYDTKKRMETYSLILESHAINLFMRIYEGVKEKIKSDAEW